MTFLAVKPDERSTVIFLGVVFALLAAGMTSYMIHALKRGEITAPTSRWLSSIKTFSRADAPIAFWFIYFVHFAVDAVFLAALVIIIYRLCL
jgi:hypothetical protein